MKKMYKFKYGLFVSSLGLAGLVLGFASPVSAHVDLDSPNGGEVLQVGSTFTITWHIRIRHDLLNWDLWYSATGVDGPFKVIAMDLPPGDDSAGSVHTYDWIVPDDVTTEGRVRVRMDNRGTDYFDISDADFTIERGGCTDNEKIRKPKCKLRNGINKMTVKLVRGTPGDTFSVELSTGQSKSGTIKDTGKGKAKFKKLPSGDGTATATWGCGATKSKNYSCP